MKTRLGMFVVVLMAVAALLPAAALAEPTRAMDAEITGVAVSGLMGPGGEYAVGDHTLTVTITNTGDELFGKGLEFFLNITDKSDDSVLVNKSNKIFVAVGIDSFRDIDLDPVGFPEGEYNITVNATINGQNNIGYLDVVILSVVDLSIQNDLFVQDSHYEIGQILYPRCIVNYVGNVAEWKDNVIVHVLIETVADVSVVLYDKTEVLMTTTSSPVTPAYTFPTLMFQVPWNVDTSGDIRATFSVEYDTYNETNNTDVVTFFVDEPASVEGYALTSDDTPIPMVNVEIRDSNNSLTTVVDTNETGYFSVFDLEDGNYSLIFSKRWFEGDLVNFTVVFGTTKLVNGTLTPLDLCGLEGYVYDPAGLPLMGAVVVAQKVGGGFHDTLSNATGYYVFDELESGTYQIRATYTSLKDSTVNQTLLAREMNKADLNMEEIPFTVIFDPPTGEPGFPVGASISLTFTRPIDQSSVDPFTIVLKNSMTGEEVVVVYNYTTDNKSIVITPVAPLLYSTNYTIEVTHWIRDVNDEGFPEDVSSYFITEDEILNVSILSRTPGMEEQNVPVGAVIRAIFSTSMNGSTITESTFKLFARGNEAVAGTVYYYPSNSTAMFVPLEDLDYGMRYSVDLSDLILAEDPAYVFYGEGWNFDVMEEISMGDVSGRVLDENGNPFPPSNVTITLTMGSQVKVQPVDPDGDFNFLMLDEGLWALSIEVDGYNIYTENVTVTAGELFNVGTVDMTVLPVEDDEEKDDYTWIIIVVILLLIIFVFLIIVFAVQGRQRPVEAEEVERRPRFGVRGHEEGYDEYFEGEFMCPNCGGVTSSDEEVCPHCDAEFEEDLFECPECGSALAGDAHECPDCGAVFEDEEEEEPEEEEFYDEEYEEDITEEYEVAEEESGYERYLEEEEEEEEVEEEIE